MTGWLAYDIGTTGTKAAYIEGNHVQRAATHTYETRFADGGVVEQNAADWWAAVQITTRQLDCPADIRGIVITGQMQDVILLDDALKPVRPVILYNDTRAHSQITAIRKLVGADALRDATGNHQDAGSLLAKLRWLQEHEPQTLNHAKHLILGAADFIVAQMTGVTFSDTTTASTTGLLDIKARSRLGDALLAKANLTNLVNLLPTFIPGGGLAGELTTTAAEALGLSSGLPVYLGPGDAGAATIGAGSGDIGSAYAYIGTSGWVAFTADTPANPDHGVITLVHPQAGRFIQVAPMMTAAGNMDWLRGIFEDESVDDLIQMGLSQEVSNLIYLPYLNGERAPFSDPFARGVMVGLSPQTSRADIYRAGLEGVVYAYKHILDALAPPDLSHLMLTGGGSRNVQWCQLFADILGIPVMVAADAENVGLYGAIRAVQVANGTETSYAITEIRTEHTLQPDSTYHDLYAQKYQLFRQTYQALEPVMRAAGQIG